MASKNTNETPPTTQTTIAASDARAQLEPVGTPAPTGRQTVKVKVIRGRILVQRKRIFDDAVDERGQFAGRIQVGTEDVYKTVGDVFEMDAEEAQKLLNRSFEGYPSIDGQPNKLAGIVRDSPIELVQTIAA